MPTALWKLYRLRIRGGLRSIGRRLKTVRGALLATFTVLIFGMMIGPNLVMSLTLGRRGVMGRTADSFYEVFPVVVLLYVVLNMLTSLSERAIHFSPSEVDFLFPAPFSRRALLLYKILSSVTGAIFIALFIPLSMVIYIRSLAAAAVGFFLVWLLVNSLTMCAQLVAQTVSERAFTRGRKLLLAGLIALAVAALAEAAGRGLDGGWQDSLLRVRHSLAAEIVLAPFAPFAKIIVAERLIPDALGWAALGTVLVVGIYAVAIRLDANYLETAVRVSRQMQERRRRLMSDGIMAATSKRVVRSSRLPRLPWLGGVGPLVWRHVIQWRRGSRRALVFIVLIVIGFAAPLVFGSHKGGGVPGLLPHMVIGIAAYLSFFVSFQTPLGFRGDYERMDLLKSLPIRPWAMACGQMLVIVTILTVLQWIAFAATACFVPAGAAELLAAGLFALPFNWVLSGTQSFLFLVYPSPLVATGSEGFLKMGRSMLFMLGTFLVLGGCAAVAAVPAGIVYLLTQSMPAACLIAWLVLLFPAAGVLFLAAWAFRRFDVAAETGE
jgi:ABC-2 type transport system permease protein